MGLPINIGIMDVREMIERDNLKPVRSSFIRESSSSEFHHEGLFSEEIFGQIGSPERLTTFGYIPLRTTIIHPFIYANICRLKALYGEILAGKTYAIFNEETKDFDRTSNQIDENAGTGYKFFIDKIKLLKFQKNNSLDRNDKIDQFYKYLDKLLIQDCLVCPAGIRDMSSDEGKPESGSINELYSALINYTKALPLTGSDNTIYDSLRFAIQKKVNEIWDYLFDMVEGKFGFFQRKYGSRNLALGTRNVISASPMSAESPDDPQFLKVDEVKIPIFQASKMYAPLLVYNIREIFLSEIFSQSSDQVSLIDPDTLQLQYQPISEDEKQKFLSSDGIEKISNLYKDHEFRTQPVVVYNEDEKPFYLFMVYDTGEQIYLVRSVAELKQALAEHNIKFKPEYLRPLTYIEMFYIALYRATNKRAATVTRYPAIGVGSDVPCKCHLVSTRPSRKVTLINQSNNMATIDLPEYPILGKQSIDSTQVHPCTLDPRMGLGGDFDGNCLVGNTRVEICYTNEWLEAISKNEYKESKQDIKEILKLLTTNSFFDPNHKLNHVVITMENFPRGGVGVLCKDGSIAYKIPSGCWIHSYDNNICTDTYEPIKTITTEKKCAIAKIYVSGREFECSTNESVATFDKNSGKIKRIKPSECGIDTYIPICKQASHVGIYGSFDEGWLLGAMISDGYITKKYIGYTKLDLKTRTTVERMLDRLFGTTNKHQYNEERKDGASQKLGPSITIRYDSKYAIRLGSSEFDMYATANKSALTKRISDKHLVMGSKDFLIGILCGLLDGDGSLIKPPNKNHIEARISTSSPYLIASLKKLAYLLGIRFSVSVVPSRNWSKESYIFLLNSHDMWQNRNWFRFCSTRNIVLYNMWKRLPEPNDNLDIIPLTTDEAAWLKNLALKHRDSGLYAASVPSGKQTISRKKIQQYLYELSCEPLRKNLFNRVINTNICWASPSKITYGDVATVYDFEVDTTKVFCVNEGVVVYDTISANGILTTEANEETNKYLNTKARYIHTNGSFFTGKTDLISLTLFNLTRDPEAI